MLFTDREDAGRRLAGRLEHLRGQPVTATYDQGILKVTVSVPEEAKATSRRIAIGHAR